MPIAYHWVSEHQEDDKQKLQVYLDSSNTNKIVFHLPNNFTIIYEKTEESTRVQCEKLKIITTVEREYIQVFCEDLKECLINRKSALAWFRVAGELSDTGITQIYECMELALKSRRNKLEVMEIEFEAFNSKQQIVLLKFIIPTDMMHIHFKSPDNYEVYNFLRNWNQGCRLGVTFEPSDASTEDLMSVKKMLNYPSTFFKITYKFPDRKWSTERLMIIFKPFKPYYAEFRSSWVIFQLGKLSESRNLTEQINRLSLRNACSSEVFEKPALLEIILEELDFFDIQRLRKVSRGIRSCIDTLKPEPHITEYSIEQRKSIFVDNYPETLLVKIYTRNDSKKWIVYRERELLQYENSWDVDEFVYCGDQLIERVFNDFKTNIEHQESTLDWLQLECNEKLLKLIRNVLESRDTPLSCKEVWIKVDNESEIMNILPFLDSVHRIIISSNKSLYLEYVPKLDQWKNASSIILELGTITNSIQELNLHNFKFIGITINSISSNDVIYLKEIAIKSKEDISFIIYYNNSSIDDSLYTSTPPYEGEPGNWSTWYFPMSLPENYFKIELDEKRRILQFIKINRDQVPPFVCNLPLMINK
uniref:F-box domain-containing protein n=1 Tax=Caenorhabditis tropicalis TaxID=1561998 RepID=A0A1I7UDZ7_9PELO